MEKHKGCDILHMRHGIVWDQKARDNVYLKHVQHVFCCVEQETKIQETGLFHNELSRLDDQHLYYVAHDTLCLSTFFYFNFFVFSMI